MSLSELIIDIPVEHERNVFGQFDSYVKKLERAFHVTLNCQRGQSKDTRRSKKRREGKAGAGSADRFVGERK